MVDDVKLARRRSINVEMVSWPMYAFVKPVAGNDFKKEVLESLLKARTFTIYQR
jgi:hypothetical protein